MNKEELERIREHVIHSRDSTDWERGSSCNGCGSMMDTPEEQADHQAGCSYIASLAIIEREIQKLEEERRR